MKKIYFSFVALVMSIGIFAQQPIQSFPYTENFEGFTLLQTSSSCDTSIKGDADAGWYQDPNDNGDWRADTAGTVSIGTGPGATLSTSGVGVGTDYNPGTTRGVYLYTEGTSATGCINSTINLLSPMFDFSKGYYRVKFAWHMFGGGMGGLHLDVWDGSSWRNSFWSRSGTADTNWHVAEVNLGIYSGDTVQFRIRGVMGSSFATDMAIDDFKVESYRPARYDAVLTEVKRELGNYLLFPLSQSDSIRFSALVYNDGIQTISGTEVRVAGSSYNGIARLGSLDPSKSIGSTLSPAFKPGQGDERLHFYCSINEADSFPSNDSLLIQTGLNDSIYAKEDGVASGGIGFNTGVGEVGQAFRIKQTDTLSSVSIFLNGPNNNDSVRVNLYRFNSTPGNLVASTQTIRVSNQPAWYTLRFNCDQVLSGGNDYFLAVEQLVNNSNMALGYTTAYHDSGMAFYGAGTAWTGLETANFFANLLIRANFGAVRYPTIQITGADTLCAGEETILEAVTANGSFYQWSPTAGLGSPSNKRTSAKPFQSTLYRVEVIDQCGFSAQQTKSIHVKKAPSAVISPDTLVCKGSNAKLRVQTNNTYQWIKGPANSDWTVQVNNNSNFQVEVDSSNGCKALFAVRVSTSLPKPEISGDTILCEGVPVTYQASGGQRYDWNGGAGTGNQFVWMPRFGYSVVLTAYDSIGCSASTSVSPQITAQPSYSLSPDTLVCFGQYVLLQFKSAVPVDLQWERGPDSNNYLVRGVFKRDYPLTFNLNGCSWSDTVTIDVEAIPDIMVSNDTSICEGQSAMLKVQSNNAAQFKWSNQSTGNAINISPKQSTRYFVAAISSNGCSNEDSIDVEVNPLPVASFGLNQSNRYFTFQNQSQFANSYLWDFGDGNNSTDKDPAHTYSQNGNYTITLKAINACGEDDSSISIQLGDPAGIEEKGPNNLRIWPNPAHDQLKVQLISQEKGPVEAILADQQGRVVKITNTAFKPLITLSLNDVSPGIYTLILNHGSRQYIGRVLKH